MKTKYGSKATFFAAMFMAVVSLEARPFDNVEVLIEENSNVVNSKMSEASLETIDLVLLDARNRVIREDQIGILTNLEQRYDFSDLDGGKYTLVSVMGNMSFNKVLEVRDSKVVMTDSYYTFKPEFKLVDNKILVNYLLDGSRNVAISIEQDSETIFDAFFDSNERVFSKSFATDKLAAGSYTMQLTSEDDFYSYEFEVE